jgi:phage-related protein
LAVPITDLVVALLPLLPVIADILVAVITVAAPLLKLVGIIISFLAQKAIVPLVTVLAEVLGFLAEAVRQFGVWLTTVDWGGVLSAIGRFFVDLWDDISGFFGDLFESLTSIPRRAAEAFVALNMAILRRVGELVEFVRSLPGRLLRALGDLGKLLIEKGKDLIRGLWNGISSLGGWLWDKVTGFVSQFIVDPIKDALGINSPSQLMADEVGRMVPAGIGEGVEAGVPQLRSLIDSLIMPVTNAVGDDKGGTVTFGPGSVIMQFAGQLPTPAQAGALAEASMAGISRAVRRRDIRAAVRMR